MTSFLFFLGLFPSFRASVPPPFSFLGGLIVHMHSLPSPLPPPGRTCSAFSYVSSHGFFSPTWPSTLRTDSFSPTRSSRLSPQAYDSLSFDKTLSFFFFPFFPDAIGLFPRTDCPNPSWMPHILTRSPLLCLLAPLFLAWPFFPRGFRVRRIFLAHLSSLSLSSTQLRFFPL